MDTLNGNMDAFISKLTTDGTLLWSTYVGTGGIDYSSDITVDSQDNVYITGNSDLYRSIIYYDKDAFLIKFNSTGTQMWTTHFGAFEPDKDDIGISLAIDSQNHIIVAGVTSSTEFPTLNASQTTLPMVSCHFSQSLF